MRIGFDVDGVFADFNKNFVRLFPQCHFPAVGDDFPDVWDYPQKYGATAEETSAVWERIKLDERFWLTLPQYADAFDALSRIDELTQRHQIYFITSRTGATAKRQTEKWLYSRGIYYPTVLIVSAAEDQKPKLISGLRLHAYIDDKLETMEACVAYNSATHYFLFDRPWNRTQHTEEDRPGGREVGGWLTRVTSVHQMLDQIGV